MRHRQNQEGCWKRKQQKVDEGYYPDSSSHALLLDEPFSEKGTRQPSKAARARFTAVAVAASEPAQNTVDQGEFNEQVEPTVDYVIEEYAEKRQENPCEKRKVSQNDESASEFQFFFAQRLTLINLRVTPAY